MRHSVGSKPTTDPVVISQRGDCQQCPDHPPRKLIRLEINLEDVFGDTSHVRYAEPVES
jgi:hypothetical protein